MKFLILASCLVAAASAAVVNIAYTPIGLTSQYHAQDILGQYSYGYSGGPSSKQETRTFDGVTHGGYSYVDANGIIQSASYVADPIHGFRIAATNDPSPSASAGTVPVVISGIPAAIVAAPVTGVADTPEVAAAKVAHFAAHAEAKARLTRKRRATYPQHIPVIGPSGVPQETPEVMAAKVEHAAAHARALGYAGAPAHYYGYPTTYPVLAADGQPLETSEVAAAKSAHFAAHAEARARNLVYTPSYYSGPYATPTIYNGVPLDTPEVAAAKNAHFAAYAKAAANAY